MRKSAVFVCLIVALSLILAGCIDYSLVDEPVYTLGLTAVPETLPPTPPATQELTPTPMPTPTATPTPTPTPSPTATPAPTPAPTPTPTPEPTPSPSPTPEPIIIFDPQTAFMPGPATRLYGIALGMNAREVFEIIGQPDGSEESDYPYGGAFLRNHYRFGWVDFVSPADNPEDFRVCHIEVDDPSFVGPRGILFGDTLFEALYKFGYPAPKLGQEVMLYKDADKKVTIVYLNPGNIQISIDYKGEICYFVVNIEEDLVNGYSMGQRID